MKEQGRSLPELVYHKLAQLALQLRQIPAFLRLWEDSQPEEPEDLLDYYDSPFLTFGNDIHVTGDPETAEEFATALSYLGLISSYFVESELFWQKTAADVTSRLTYYNEWHKYEVEQEHKVGETSTTYREVTIQHLCALSERRVRAMEDTGWEVTETYRMACFFHRLVKQAATNYPETQQLLNQSASDGYSDIPDEDEDGVPF